MIRTRSPLRACALVLLGVCLLAVAAVAEDSAALLVQADRDFAEARFDAARLMYEQALAAGAKLDIDPVRSRNLGRCYLSKPHPDLQRGARWLQTSLQLVPQAEETRHLLAQAQMELGAYADAEQNYRLLVLAHPANPDYVLGVAAALRQGASVQAAAEYLRSALELGASGRTVRLEYARLLAFQRQLPEARRQYEILLAAEPGNLVAQVGLAKVTSWQGNQEDALRQYERILQRTPSLYDALVGKAFSLLWMGRKSEAVGLLREASRRHPEDAEVREALALGATVPEGKSERAVERPRPVISAQVTRPAPSATAATPAPSTRAVASPAATPNPSRATGLRSPVVKFAIALGVLLALLLLRSFLPIPGMKSWKVRAPEAPPPMLEWTAPLDVAPSPDPPASVALPEVAPEPAPPHPEPVPIVAPPSVPKSVLAGARVLIVGRDPALVEVERRSLANTAAVVTTSASWNEVLRLLESDPPDLLLLNPLIDDQWTGMTAYVWLTVHRPELQACTVLVLSTEDDVSDQICRSTHAHVLYQPFTPAELVGAAGAVIEARQQSRKPPVPDTATLAPRPMGLRP